MIRISCRTLKAMTNFDGDSSNRLTFILSGQPELASTLQFAHFDALRARIRLSHPLGNYRLFYAINEDEIVVVIVKLEHRQSAYK